MIADGASPDLQRSIHPCLHSLCRHRSLLENSRAPYFRASASARLQCASSTHVVNASRLQRSIPVHVSTPATGLQISTLLSRRYACITALELQSSILPWEAFLQRASSNPYLHEDVEACSAHSELHTSHTSTLLCLYRASRPLYIVSPPDL